jgi:predicted  nucleic acid-binding Zn-ribbon protein
MGIFDGSKSEQIKYLEEERAKLWERIISIEKYIQGLEREIKTRTPETEKEAKEHSKRAAEYRNKTEQRLEEATELVNNLRVQLNSAEELKTHMGSLCTHISEVKFEVDEAKIKVDSVEKDYKEKVDSVEKRIESIDEIFVKYPDLDEELTEIDAFIQKIEENQKKSSITLSAINTRKTEIDDLHLEIFGYKEENESGEEIIVDGIKNKLENAYNKLAEELSISQKQVVTLNNDYANKYSDFEKSYKNQYELILAEIRTLLTNALTAGLSSAFSKKKEDEVEASKQLQKRFSNGIYLLLGISTLPVLVSVVSLFQNISLEEVIIRLPRLVLAIIPMYIPALWITYSASKKLNLSKRLSEEYAHKEVLSRTYEGLSNQIANISDKGQSEELKVRLLTNFLQASSENPGKLISNYETSDHPVMEALEQSYKLQKAIEKLTDIPGLDKIAAILGKNAKRKLEEKAEKIILALSDEEDEENT